MMLQSQAQEAGRGQQSVDVADARLQEMLPELRDWYALAFALASGVTRPVLWLWLLTSRTLVVFRRAVRTSTACAQHSLPEHPACSAPPLPAAAPSRAGGPGI